MKKILAGALVLSALALVSACKSSTTDTKQPTIASFSASPASIHRGESSTLSWTVSDATSLTINQGVGAVTGATGTKTVSPTETTTYTLTATNVNGTKTSTATVTIQLVPPTIASFTAAPASIRLGDPSTLNWSVTNATTVSIDHGVGTVAATGTQNVTPDATTTYTLTATNGDGSQTGTATVTILPMAAFNTTTDPHPVVWTYDEATNTTSGTFACVLIETNGVAGRIDDIYCGLYDAQGNRLRSKMFGSGTFAAYGTLSVSNSTSAPGKPVIMAFLAEGVDANGYAVYGRHYANITWPAGVAVVRFQPVTEPITDPSMQRILDELKSQTRKR